MAPIRIRPIRSTYIVLRVKHPNTSRFNAENGLPSSRDRCGRANSSSAIAGSGSNRLRTASRCWPTLRRGIIEALVVEMPVPCGRAKAQSSRHPIRGTRRAAAGGDRRHRPRPRSSPPASSPSCARSCAGPRGPPLYWPAQDHVGDRLSASERLLPRRA